eukprot:TRINITY_DN958_c0_g1_i1.p1 TRINITY_DN958_c0_g1~~TRINITY_DN958_c0_g1_i1.p1  ORF type:complete len:594 (+),score=98.80 TRINITY_DN958_c0_g1_i1:67-1848(+)
MTNQIWVCFTYLCLFITFSVVPTNSQNLCSFVNAGFENSVLFPWVRVPTFPDLIESSQSVSQQPSSSGTVYPRSGYSFFSFAFGEANGPMRLSQTVHVTPSSVLSVSGYIQTERRCSSVPATLETFDANLASQYCTTTAITDYDYVILGVNFASNTGELLNSPCYSDPIGFPIFGYQNGPGPLAADGSYSKFTHYCDIPSDAVYAVVFFEAYQVSGPSINVYLDDITLSCLSAPVLPCALTNPGAEVGLLGWHRVNDPDNVIASVATQDQNSATTFPVKPISGQKFFSFANQNTNASFATLAQDFSLTESNVFVLLSGFIQTEWWCTDACTPNPTPNVGCLLPLLPPRPTADQISNSCPPDAIDLYDYGLARITFFSRSRRLLGRCTSPPLGSLSTGDNNGPRPISNFYAWKSFSLNCTIPTGTVSGQLTLFGFLKQGSSINVFYDKLSLSCGRRTVAPTRSPTPTISPTLPPTTRRPTFLPTLSTTTPTPTAPPTAPPTLPPTTRRPTFLPTLSTTTPTPTAPPTAPPTLPPTRRPTFLPTLSTTTPIPTAPPTAPPTLPPTTQIRTDPPTFRPNRSLSPKFRPSRPSNFLP